jgi:hypothetical protein
MPRLSLGSELWRIFYSAPKNIFTVGRIGKVTRIFGSKVFAGGRWHDSGGRAAGFMTKVEAQAWCAAHSPPARAGK